MTLPFSKYILQFSKNTENEQTHLSFKNGKYNIPDNYADVFYKRYYQEMTIEEKRRGVHYYYRPILFFILCLSRCAC